MSTFNKVPYIQSDRKARLHYVQVKEEKRLPYPIPLINSSGQVQYPLDNKIFSVVYFNCYINYGERCCEVKEECSMQALYYHGFFGKGSLSNNAPTAEVADIIRQRKKQKNAYICSQEASLDAAFPMRPDHGSIIDDLYRKTPPTSRSSSPSPSSPSSSSFPIEPIPIQSTYQPIKNVSPADSRETLRLSLEETFFLAYALGCMTVTDSLNGSKLNLTQIWAKFCSLHCPTDKSEFAGYYAAYHYFRSKGWVVKSGTKFGCDFIIYKEGPAHYHAIFSAIVFILKSNQTIANKYKTRDWQFHSGWDRLSEGVSKKPIQCIVIIPEHLKDADLSDPRVIKSFEIRTNLLKRFVASQGREAPPDRDI
ncbi:probable tRNA-splicing endonuclease subunit sen2 [Tetranychus urticae]|uniref:probable tRNA-splicing endonuclease subunit sen2 n=1 Tax=Tetranychus urticae TaxID=32264 RepID=UPI00077BBC5A|nr:probable tRNA-splicing endonuclease subunit sen2 [Tetranychus urticae]